MQSKTTLLGSALLGALVLAAALAPPAAAADTQSSTAPQSAATTASIGGKAQGLWNLPGPAGPGRLHGLLRGPFGIPLFEVEAVVLPKPGGPAGPSGSIDGVVRRLFGPNPGAPFAALKGTWAAGPGGKGKLSAVMLVPGSGGPQPVGKLKGAFQDPSLGPLPGKFLGKWHVKLP